MKHLKTLVLAAVAAASLLAFAASASAAPVLTSPAGTEYTGTIHATLEAGTSTTLRANIEDTCTESTAHGTVSVNNSTHAEGALTATGVPPTGLSFEKCTQHTRVVNPGTLTINDAGEVFTIASRVEVNVTGLTTCWYGAETGSVKIGTLTTGTPAELTINTTSLQREPPSSMFWCKKEGTWTGNYVVTTPSSLFIT